MSHEKWEGGYVLRTSSGARLYYIRKQLDGRRWDLSTGCADHEAALVEYRRWRAAPHEYRRTAAAVERLVLDAALVAEFLEWSRVKGNSAPWLSKQQHALAFWAQRLRGIDLRRVDLRRDVLPALEGAPARHHLAAVLKTLYSWLRAAKHDIRAAEDPVMGVLRVPAPRPEQWKRPKSIPVESYQRVRTHLPEKYRHALDLLAGTGWHTTELERFAANGRVEELPDHRKAEAAAILLVPQTKSGAPLRTAVSQEVADAARALLGTPRTKQDRGPGPIDLRYLLRCIHEACDAAGVERFSPGRFRHSVATWAIERGADPAAVAAFLGHKSPRTTQRFYATLATPRKVPTLL